jgi:hypothetical protein
VRPGGGVPPQNMHKCAINKEQENGQRRGEQILPDFDSDDVEYAKKKAGY